jgi:hypothetical protein
LKTSTSTDPLATYALVIVLAWFAIATGAASADRDPEWPRTDFSKRTVELAEILPGGPPKDGIPSIDRPVFVSYAEADVWLNAQEPVIALAINRDARAYPLQILIYHEIVNDRVDGIPVAVTFCPLCNAAMTFDRRINGRMLDFGTTGKLRKSDLVMYDRQTESWWQQFTGRAIVGEFAGAELKSLPAQIVSYADFKTAHPNGKVLSRDTGYSRPYGRNPYRGYDRMGDHPFLFSDPVDPRLPAMERVIGVTMSSRHRIYPFTALAGEPVINDEIGGAPIVVLSREGMRSPLDADLIRESREIASAAAYSRGVDGQVLHFERREGRILDRETGSEWNIFGHATAGPLKGKTLEAVESGVHFAFAWLAFNPASEIYGKRSERFPATGAQQQLR